jgi:hypothetical protein
MTGDVFRGVDIPGVEQLEGDDDRLGMVVSHPCSMRSGHKLKDRVQVIRILKSNPIKIDAWPKLYYDRLPLPDLTVIVDPDDVSAVNPENDIVQKTEEGAHAAFFELRGRVESANLQLDQRIACLSEQGVALLHQRMAHGETRYAPDVEHLMLACDAVFAEVELWEQWNERLVDPDAISHPVVLQAELDRVAKQFDIEMSKKRAIPDKKNGWYVLRDDLSIPKRHAAARREVLKLLDEQTKTLSFAGL